jgi:hypothetical protein
MGDVLNLGMAGKPDPAMRREDGGSEDRNIKNPGGYPGFFERALAGDRFRRMRGNRTKLETSEGGGAKASLEGPVPSGGGAGFSFTEPCRSNLLTNRIQE